MMRQLRNPDACSVSKIESELLKIYPEPRDLPTQRFAQLASQTIFGNAKLRLSKIWTSAPSNAELQDSFARLLLAASSLKDILLPSVPHLLATKRTEGPNQNRRSNNSNFSFASYALLMQELGELLRRQGETEVAANQVIDRTASDLSLLIEALKGVTESLVVRRGEASADLARRNHLDDSLVGGFFTCFDKLPPQTIDHPFYQCVELSYRHCQISLEKETISKRIGRANKRLKARAF